MGESSLTSEEITRYSRHLLLPGVGLAGQERLSRASVLCVGAGGLGSPVLMYLAAAGVGKLGVIDPDDVDLTNLQRQIVHGSADVGSPKVVSAQFRLSDLNPHVAFEAYPYALDAENVRDLVAGYDLVVDGSDSLLTRYLVDEACEELDKSWVFGAIYRFEGQVSVFSPRSGPSYRDLHPTPPRPELVPACGEGGVLGVLPGVIGTLQATEALKLLLGTGESLLGRLLVYDALAMRFSEFSIARRADRPAHVAAVARATLCDVPSPTTPEKPMPAPFQSITARDLKRRLDEGWKPYVLDVRKPAEADVARLAFADRLQPHETVAQIAAELPRDRDIVVHCKGGVRSAAACQTLAALGFTRLYNLEGGIGAWSAEVDPTIPRY